MDIDFNNSQIGFVARSDKQLKKIYWIFRIINSPFIVKLGTRTTIFLLRIKLFPIIILKKTLFEHFCGGETLEECKKCMDSLHQYNIKSILDYSAESENTEEQFHKNTEEFLKKIIFSAQNRNTISFAVIKMSALIDPKILTKIQSQEPLSQKETELFHNFKHRVEKITDEVHTQKIKLLVDAEEYQFQNTVDTITYEMMEKHNTTEPFIYNTFQMYRIDMYKNLEKAHKKAQEKKYFLGVKLVRGAYMEKERMRAKQMNYPDPIHKTQDLCNKSFNKGLEYCMKYYDEIGICLGTHNEESIKYFMELMQVYNIPNNYHNIYFAQLLGMSDVITFTLASQNYNVAKYVPYGKVRKVIPYLIRRAEENTSIYGQSSRELLSISDEIYRRKTEKQKNR